jgi:hypothetical protein
MMFTRQHWRTADKTKHRAIFGAIIVKMALQILVVVTVRYFTLTSTYIYVTKL